MKLVVCEPENIPPWIFPAVLPEYPDPGIGVEFPEMTDVDFVALARDLEVEAAIDDPFLLQNSGCDVGFSHDAPDFVLQIKPKILDALIAIPEHERWRTAERWAALRLNKRPSKEELTFHKKHLKTLCEFAAMAVAKEQILVLVHPYA